MEQSPYWEANRSLASQEMTCILWKLKVHTLFTTASNFSLSWAMWNQFTPSLPVSWRSISRLFSFLHPVCKVTSLRCHHQIPGYSCFLLLASHMAHPAFLPGFVSNSWQVVQMMKLIIMQLFPASCYFIPHYSKYFPYYLADRHP